MSNTTKQITIDEDKVMCTCGFYDKSSTPIVMARSHNSRDHKGRFDILDREKGAIDQLTGKPLIHDRNQRERDNA